MQTRRASAIEVCTGTAAAFLLSVGVGQYLIYPLYDIHPALSTNFILTGWFTVISIVRGYLWRRLFNWLGR